MSLNNTVRPSIYPLSLSWFPAGCDSGFGHALALRLQESVSGSDGLRVYAGCLNASSPGAQELGDREGVVVLQMDVTDPEQVRKAVEVVREDKEHGG